MPENTRKGPGEVTDGRMLRAEENRRKVARAMLELLREGVMQPTREQVAERSGLSLRSVYHHYNNMESLHEETCRIQFSSIHGLVNDPPRGKDERLSSRIEAFADRRAELYERITPVRRSAMTWIHRSQALAKGIAGLSETLRKQLYRTFQPELERVAPARLENLLDALEAATCWEAWDFMRARKGFSSDRCRRALCTALAGLLAPYDGQD